MIYMEDQANSEETIFVLWSWQNPRMGVLTPDKYKISYGDEMQLSEL